MHHTRTQHTTIARAMRGMPRPASVLGPVQPSRRHAGGMPTADRSGQPPGTGGAGMPAARAPRAFAMEGARHNGASGRPQTRMPMPDAADLAVMAARSSPRFGPPGGIGLGGGGATSPASSRSSSARTSRRPCGRRGPPVPDRRLGGGPLDDMNQLLEQHGLLQAEPTFETRARTTRRDAVAVEQGMDVPHLAQFMTLHFAQDADTVADRARA